MLQPARGREALRRQPIARSAGVELFDPEKVILVRPFDRQAQLVRQHSRLPAMIKVPVGDENLLQSYTGLLNTRLQLVKIATGSGERGFHGLGAPNKRAVLLKRRHRQDRGAHGGNGFDGQLGRFGEK